MYVPPDEENGYYVEVLDSMEELLSGSGRGTLRFRG